MTFTERLSFPLGRIVQLRKCHAYLCEIKGGEKCRNHFLSNLVTTLILVMLDAFEANL